VTLGDRLDDIQPNPVPLLAVIKTRNSGVGSNPISESPAYDAGRRFAKYNWWTGFVSATTSKTTRNDPNSFPHGPRRTSSDPV
jgi:hypothetical protein